MPEPQIAYCSVFPKIGIARLGNSTKHFIGPEAPGVVPEPHGGFKDEYGFSKRQAARFRVYAFDAQDTIIGELTAQNTGSITWRVSLANKKASWYEFDGARKAFELFEGRIPENPPPLRNNDWPGDRRQLVMKSNATIFGPNQTSAPFLGTIFQHKRASIPRRTPNRRK